MSLLYLGSKNSERYDNYFVSNVYKPENSIEWIFYFF